jgi:hypothetical protein
VRRARFLRFEVLRLGTAITIVLGL